MMQYDRNFASMAGDDVVILQPDKPAAGFRYDATTDRLSPATASAKMTRTALAHAMWGTDVYGAGVVSTAAGAEEIDVGRSECGGVRSE